VVYIKRVFCFSLMSILSLFGHKAWIQEDVVFENRFDVKNQYVYIASEVVVPSFGICRRYGESIQLELDVRVGSLPPFVVYSMPSASVVMGLKNEDSGHLYVGYGAGVCGYVMLIAHTLNDPIGAPPLLKMFFGYQFLDSGFIDIGADALFNLYGRRRFSLFPVIRTAWKF